MQSRHTYATEIVALSHNLEIVPLMKRDHSEKDVGAQLSVRPQHYARKVTDDEN